MTFERVSIAILALGGQGGGVLADWIQEMARHEGWLAQGTSIPGVAQRTGSTVYYVELARADGEDREPVMAQMPVPGDVDIVIASELMETGRAMLRGFSTADRTTLIGSTSRIYAISEKSSMGDGRGNSAKIIEAAGRRSKRFIGFDMEAAANRSGSVISAVMFGALAGARALPFSRERFEETIRASGIAVPSNMAGFDEGFRAAGGGIQLPVETENPVPRPTTRAGTSLAERVRKELPERAHAFALHGAARLMDYQDDRYATLYLDRLKSIAALDGSPFELTSEAARHLALWMSYEDTVRVADLKTRGSRVDRVRSEVKAANDQLLGITEFMHPRLQEVCDTLPAPIGRAILKSPFLTRMLTPLFQAGRHVETTSLRWFLMLRVVAGMRRMRSRSLRYITEQARIEDWLNVVREAASRDNRLAVELVRCQRLIKGYGETYDRGLKNFSKVIAHVASIGASVDELQRWCEVALADESGVALHLALASSAE